MAAAPRIKETEVVKELTAVAAMPAQAAAQGITLKSRLAIIRQQRLFLYPGESNIFLNPTELAACATAALSETV